MATMTSQILIGRPHPNDDGIIPSHYLFLSENNRPGWILFRANIHSNGKWGRQIIWIPTVENMLEDAFLMIVIHVLKDDKVLHLARSFTPKIQSPRLELYSEFTDEQRNLLYEECKLIDEFPKLIISAFKDSYILKQLNIVQEYLMDVEICAPIYTRLYSAWGNSVDTHGVLPEGGSVTINSEYSAFEKLPDEITNNIDLIDSTDTELINEVHWYEFGFNTKSLIQEKANECKKDIKQLMIECGYSIKSSRIDKFKVHQENWLNLTRTIPKSYLTAIGVSIEDIEKTVEADYQSYQKAINEVMLEYCKLGYRYGHFLEIVTENRAIELLKAYSELRGTTCEIRYKDVKTIKIDSDFGISIKDYVPEIKISKNDIGFKMNPLISKR